MPFRASLSVGLGALALATAVLVPSVARADKSADAAHAEALFEEGHRLMIAQDYANACPKLAESQRLDPAPGTVLNLAACYEREGKTASAWAAYKAAQAATQAAGQKERAAAAARKATELEAKLSRMTFTVSPDARMGGLEIRCDGEPVREPEWGTALPYDPGPHDVEVRAPGRRAWHTRAELRADRDRATIAIPVLEAEPAAVAEPASGGPGGVQIVRESGPSEAAPETKGRGRTQRLAGALVGGVGVLGLGVGIFTGLRAKSTYDDATAACGGTRCPVGSPGLSLRDDATSWATASTVGFIAGGALLATGALLFLTAPHETAQPPQVGIALAPAAQGTGLSLAGKF
jgi:hypothetical protein